MDAGVLYAEMMQKDDHLGKIQTAGALVGIDLTDASYCYKVPSCSNGY